MTRTRAAVLALSAALVAGCAARMERAAALQAADDFKCPVEQISTEKVAFARYRETGCGKQATYQMVGECYFDWNPCRASKLAPEEAH